jgi:hypothetical protein
VIGAARLADTVINENFRCGKEAVTDAFKTQNAFCEGNYCENLTGAPLLGDPMRLFAKPYNSRPDPVPSRLSILSASSSPGRPTPENADGAEKWPGPIIRLDAAAAWIRWQVPSYTSRDQTVSRYLIAEVAKLGK